MNYAWLRENQDRPCNSFSLCIVFLYIFLEEHRVYNAPGTTMSKNCIPNSFLPDPMRIYSARKRNRGVDCFCASGVYRATHSLDLAQVIKAIRPSAQHILAHGQVGLLVTAVLFSHGKQALGFQRFRPHCQIARRFQHADRKDFLKTSEKCKIMSII